jgi:hypothetical protein
MSLSETVRLAASVLAKHANGAGGRAVAASRTPEERREFARQAAHAKWAKWRERSQRQKKVIL